MRLFTFWLLLTVTLVSTFVQAQNEAMLQSTRDRLNFSNLSIPVNGNGTLFGIKGPDGKVIGDTYLDTTWQAGNIKFYGKISPTVDSLAGVPVRIDLATNEVEIRASAKDIRAVQAPNVRYVVMNNQLGMVSRYINVREYRGEADKLSGYFEQLATGKIELLLHPRLFIKKANYNAALNTGTRDDEIIKKTDWYVAKAKEATKFSPGKKAILELMVDKKDQIEAFLKTEKNDLKSRSGLIAVINYYNSL